MADNHKPSAHPARVDSSLSWFEPTPSPVASSRRPRSLHATRGLRSLSVRSTATRPGPRVLAEFFVIRPLLMTARNTMLYPRRLHLYFPCSFLSRAPVSTKSTDSLWPLWRQHTSCPSRRLPYTKSPPVAIERYDHQHRRPGATYSSTRVQRRVAAQAVFKQFFAGARSSSRYLVVGSGVGSGASMATQRVRQKLARTILVELIAYHCVLPVRKIEYKQVCSPGTSASSSRQLESHDSILRKDTEHFGNAALVDAVDAPSTKRAPATPGPACRRCRWQRTAPVSPRRGDQRSASQFLHPSNAFIVITADKVALCDAVLDLLSLSLALRSILHASTDDIFHYPLLAIPPV
ncbi:hypothetical protein AURDEDRAFT_176924 [Auricularia subglabra TFB-10046 SS5]|uniref:Uncharacterized protein n=1 Tax=Auricularia subglabra (strain TFB-10046 / SS5) TaxID=717982 RepID=J0CUL2_AURST|nr:hypothetical protein AURDEDRAFT_176924 [Auricularia subglabra TFB-10046 SS5]